MDILASGEVVSFISHCGAGSVLEAIYHSVPLVGMPIFLDQGDIATRLEKNGVSVNIDKDYSTSEEIADAIITSVTNKT